MASGRPAVLITDGEVQDSAALDGLRERLAGRSCCRVRTVRNAMWRIATMDAPRAAVEGDSLAIRSRSPRERQGAAAGSVSLLLDQRTLGRWPLEAMSACGERQLDVRVQATRLRRAPASCALS